MSDARPGGLATAAMLVGFLATVAACSPSAPSGSAAPTANPGAASTVTVTLTPAGCVPVPSSVPAGTITFSVTNQGADSVSEVELKQGDTIVGERENLTPGVTATFSVQLAAGSYILECPGATTDQSAFTVTSG